MYQLSESDNFCWRKNFHSVFSENKHTHMLKQENKLWKRQCADLSVFVSFQSFNTASLLDGTSVLCFTGNFLPYFVLSFLLLGNYLFISISSLSLCCDCQWLVQITVPCFTQVSSCFFGGVCSKRLSRWLCNCCSFDVYLQMRDET